MNYETFEHEADIGIRGYGRTIEEAFEHAAMAMYSVIVDISAVRTAEKRSIIATAPDPELLLVEWLNGLLALSDIERMVFSQFEITLHGTSLSADMWGERMDPERHKPHVEVKGATYHLLKVGQQGDRYIAQCVVDV